MTVYNRKTAFSSSNNKHLSITAIIWQGELVIYCGHSLVIPLGFIKLKFHTVKTVMLSK